MKQLISVVVPIHNEAPNIPLLYQELDTHTRSLPYRFEFIFVDDGSSDESIDILQKLSNKDRRIHLIEFARNFGKEAAVSAGLTAWPTPMALGRTAAPSITKRINAASVAQVVTRWLLASR